MRIGIVAATRGRALRNALTWLAAKYASGTWTHVRLAGLSRSIRAVTRGG